ncbi:MAG: hypothetical protein AAFR27_08670 [Pseudomonadota bacterium]
MTVTTIDFPAFLLKAQANQFRLASRGEMFSSAYNPAPRVGGPRFKQWIASYSFNVLYETAERDLRFEMEAFIHRLDGGHIAFRIWDDLRRLPRGAAAGISRNDKSRTEYFRTNGSQQFSLTTSTRLVDGSGFASVHEAASRHADSIVLSGLVPDADVFQAGDLMEISGNLHEVRQLARSDANGRSRVDLNNRLWRPVTTDEKVNLSRPKGRFVLMNNEQGQFQRSIITSSGGFECIEVPYE